MNGFKRALSLAAGLLLASGLMFGNVTLGGVAEVLEVGPALANGTVQFTLTSQSGSGTLSVSLPVLGGDSAAVVAAKIQAAVSAVGGSTWSAQASDRTVTFSYFDGSVWTPVTNLSGLSNTAGAADFLAADMAGCGARIVISINANPSGRVMSGAPGNTSSTLTFRINGVDTPFTMTFAPGQSSTSIVSALASYLNPIVSGGFGGYTVLTPTSISIGLLTQHAAFVIQTNDSALQGQVVVTETNGGGSGGGGIGHGGQPPA